MDALIDSFKTAREIRWPKKCGQRFNPKTLNSERGKKRIQPHDCNSKEKGLDQPARSAVRLEGTSKTPFPQVTSNHLENGLHPRYIQTNPFLTDCSNS